MNSRLLLLGAGRSASSLIQYLLRHAPAENWFLTVADANPAHLAPVLAAHFPIRPRRAVFDRRCRPAGTSWCARPMW